MWMLKYFILVTLVLLVKADKTEEDDTAKVFMDAMKNMLTDKDTIDNLQGMASAFVQSSAGKHVGEMFSGGGGSGPGDAMSQIVSGVGRLFQSNSGEGGFSMLGTVIDALASSNSHSSTKNKRSTTHQRGEVEQEESGFDFESILNVGSMLLGRKGNTDVLMGLMPMILENLSGGSSENEVDPVKKHDHSGHSWYLPPVLEYIHVMWDHFSNSEFAQTLWKNSGLNKIVAQMMDKEGNIQYEAILDSFENPTLRRRWITSMTNFVAEWVSHVSEPTIQQRYLSTLQFVINSFLKSQGFPRSVMFDANKSIDSLSRVADAMAQRHLNMKIDSSMYIKPAIAYIQELISLASDKGFIMSRINARELSNRLSKTINNDLIGPPLKAYRAYKWAIKSPQCSSQILCSINEGIQDDDTLMSKVRNGLQKVASFPAAWAVSNKLGTNFWTLYGAIMEQQGCIQKYPANCTAFHEEEIRVTTESTHSEL